MKRSVMLLGMVLSMLLVVAQDFYTIQVRSLSHETPLTMEELEIGMWQHKVNGQTKCFLGRYETYNEAKAALIPLKEGQYAGAFVVSSDKIFGVSAPVEVITKAKAEVVVKKPDVPVAATVVNATPPVKKVKIKVYTVQIAAYRFPLYTKEFTLEEEVMEYYCSDNMYRYSVGKFEDEAAARALLKKIRESGYPDAFLVDYQKYEEFRIE